MKLSHRLVVSVTVLQLFAMTMSSAYSQQMPNRDDLKAAYCIPDMQSRSRGDGLEKLTKLSSDLEKFFATETDKASTDLARLQAYLRPRTKYLDLDSLNFARLRGVADSTRYSRDLESCLESCRVHDLECLTNACPTESAAGIRLRTCDDLSFLPF